MFNQFSNASVELEQLNQNASGFSEIDPFSSSARTYRQISRSRFVTESETDNVERTIATTRSLAAIRAQLDSYDDINPTRWATYKDDYRLSSSTGGQFRIQMSSSEFDTYLQIIDFNTGAVLAYNDDAGSSSNSQITFTIEGGKNYIVRATSYAPFATGRYQIDAQQATAPPTGREFNRTYGYGLVDAAAAVAQAMSQPKFTDVPNLGGNNWGNDMINAPEVWARNITGRGITVAVIDSGVDITHSDLRNNIWVNRREVPNDGIDNDQNGYVDDIYGWNFGQGQFNNNVMPGTSDPGQTHGTHVAGTIAASNNNFGVTGVAPNAQIMALRLGDVSGNRFTNAGSLAQAVRYAVDNGARVINMSLGWSDSAELASALSYAASRNVITVSAAGNESEPVPGTPANYATRWGLSVGAVDRMGAIASFSNRAGSDPALQHVVAPGVQIYSTVPGNRYDFSSGTSMAAPAVAGVVALMLSANPNLTHDQVRRIMTGTTAQGASVGQALVMTDFVGATIAKTSEGMERERQSLASIEWIMPDDRQNLSPARTAFNIETGAGEVRKLESMPMVTVSTPMLSLGVEFDRDFTVLSSVNVQQNLEWEIRDRTIVEDFEMDA